MPNRAEKYLREVWPAVTRALKEHSIGCELNLVGAMSPLHSRHSFTYIVSAVALIEQR